MRAGTGAVITPDQTDVLSLCFLFTGDRFCIGEQEQGRTFLNVCVACLL
ncbi:hypothetical protein ATPR_1836 [Acetobacter tropicalis NBRC 101654]|uniref:Uncharacterized protein n=1 Tax=Acetobacter tropicalis NBRC 101654 TaxID=749388 RepID=F7VEN7_9PROT|nr:hypothetical protein ATPR_1836 [Acetobacter tropicalis NBRC 101654]